MGRAAQVIKRVDEYVSICVMNDGDVGEVMYWKGGEGFIGEIIQKFGDVFIPFGKPKGYSFKLNLDDPNDHNSIRVRILTRGDVIQIL